MKYGELTFGQVEAIVNKLGGMEGVKRFLSGEMVIREMGKFKIWKTIKLGTGLKTAEDFRRVLRDGGFEFCDSSSHILEEPAFTVAAEETEVDLVKITVAELGFKKGVERDQVYELAQDLGLELCSPEVGPQLRLQYQDQPNGEYILVAMEPIISSGTSWVFNVSVGRDGLEMSLSRWRWGDPDDLWGPSQQFVFCRPRK